MPLAFSASRECFDVADTLECGQVFRYKKLSADCDGTNCCDVAATSNSASAGELSRYAVFSADKYAELATTADAVEVYSADAEYFWHYFDMETDYSQKVARISALSPIMQKAAECGKGIRILNQNLEETIFSFIISANNNIKRIQAIIERLCDALGEPTEHGKAFPTVKNLAAAPAEVFASLGAGYRDKYLKNTALRLENYNLSALSALDSATARAELLKFEGVGPKVADCVLLFGMHRGDVFPVDTWLKKVYHQYFEQGHRDAELSTFFVDLFGDDAGLCQQYLFFYQRKYGQTGKNGVK